MEQNIATAANANGFACGDSQTIQQGEGIGGGVPMVERSRENPGLAVAGQIGRNQLEMSRPPAGGFLPILTRAREAVQQQEGFTASMNLKIESTGCAGGHFARISSGPMACEERDPELFSVRVTEAAMTGLYKIKDRCD
jgi:hypothetical protein